MKDSPKKIRRENDETIEATAAAWLAQRDDGLTPEEAETFAAWRRADPRHEAAVARLESAWTALQQLRNYRPEARMHPDRDLLRSPKPRPVSAFPAMKTLAAAATLAIAAGWWFTRPEDVRNEPHYHYATTVDGYERVTLADGSVLELNATSEARVHFTPAERRVRLLRGEAHFTVAKDAARPFSVEAGELAVHALGTAFSVRLGMTDIEVLVTKGQVEVEQVQKRVVPNAAARSTEPGEAHPGRRARSSGTLLAASERALIPVTGVTVAPPVVEKVTPDVIREALAWQEPRLVFVDTPLADVVAQFNRRNHVQLVLADEELETLPIGGSFRAENLGAFVRLLESDNDIIVDRPDAGSIVLRLRK